MAKFRSIISPLLIFFIVIIGVSTALFEDQVGLFDWKRSFVGKVKFAKFEGKRILVATEGNVVASLSSTDGHIQWRQVLEDPKEQQPQLLHLDREVILITGGQNTFYVRGWETSTGSLIWEWTVPTEGVSPALWGAMDSILVHLVPITGSHIEVTKYRIRTGENNEKTTKIITPWLSKGSECLLRAPFLVCLSNKQLYYANVFEEEVKISAIPSPDDSSYILGFEGSHVPSILLVSSSGNAKIVNFEESTARILDHSFKSSAILMDNNKLVELDIIPNDPNNFSPKPKESQSEDGVLTVKVDYPIGLGAPYVIAVREGEVLLSSTDNALSLMKLSEGKVVWTREEALSRIAAAEFFELPLSEHEASIESEFKASLDEDVFGMLSHRISTQTKQLFSFFGGHLGLLKNGLVRDEFGLHKIIVVATSVGKLFAIDTLTGSLVWTYRLPNVEVFSNDGMRPGMLLLVQRTARFSPLPGQCLLLAKDSNTGNTVLFRFDPITGISTEGIQRLSYPIKQALLAPHPDADHLKAAILIDTNDNVHVYPEASRTAIEKDIPATFLYTVDPKISILQGYRLTDSLRIKKMWEVNLGPSQIVQISTRPTGERVHSQGRVLPDRSVYYKYVNPNLVAIATVTQDPVHRQVLSVYLIDGITGLVLYSTSHRRAKGPIHLVHSENWVIYSFFNDRFRRTEIVAAELYEGHIQSNSTAFSSFAVSQLPHVQTQSYILPANPVSMAVTLTERGITNKNLLAATSTGSVSEIPWILLQPRFQDIPCGPEESCIPYMPEIPLPPDATINYNQTLSRPQGIQVAPARLESTCHVLVHGLDLFYTRLAPSKSFDVLKEDFDYKLIILVLVGLIVSSVVAKYLGQQRALKQAWK